MPPAFAALMGNQDPIQPISSGSLFRAVAVGLMANNVFPLRMGEVVRSWYLARETGAKILRLPFYTGGKKGIDGFLDNLSYNVDQIVKALSG